MDNLLMNQELQLERFAEFLLKRHLAPERNAPFYVGWVRKFLKQGVRTPTESLEQRIEGFLQEMKATGNCQDWQHTQAERALRLFFVNFKSDTTWSAPVVPRVTPNPDGTFDRAATLEATRTQLRLKHYAYATEKTYLEAGAFFECPWDSPCHP
jgi:hypothetical protein